METKTTHKTALGLNGFGWANVISDLPYDFDAILKHTAKLGFDGVELFGLPDEYPATAEDQVALRKRIEDHGLQVASIQSLPGGLGNGHPGSAYSLCRQQYVDYIKEMLEMAATMESDSLVGGGDTGWLDIDLWEHPHPMAGAEAGKRVLDDYLVKRK